MILAAGLGTRLRPLTDSIPKPLVPLKGRPMLGHTLRKLKKWGVQHVMVNLHHRAEDLFLYLREEAASLGLQLNASYEPEILGTGGVLRPLEGFIGRHPFWMLNADITFRLNPAPLLQRFKIGNPAAMLWMTDRHGPRTVDLDGEKILNFRSASPGADGTATFCGLQLLSPDILEYIPKDVGFSTIVAAYEKAMQAGRTVRGVRVPGSSWADVGTPEQYLDAHGLHKPEQNWVDPKASVHPSARLSRSVVLSGARIGAKARLDSAIVAPGCRVNHPASGMITPLQPFLSGQESAALAPLKWPADGTVETLPARGSDRAFYRLRAGSKSAMLIRYRLTRPENEYYGRHTCFLRDLGIPVPTLLAEDRKSCFQLLEDLGGESLQDREQQAPGKTDAFYEQALSMIRTLHSEGLSAARRRRLPLMPGFDRALYRWEHALFLDHFLARFAPDWDAQALRKDFSRLMRVMLEQPPVLIHRDLQSSNLLLRNKKLYLIDYQGMRSGSALYDIGSLLCDPYTDLPEERRNRLLNFYLVGHPNRARLEEAFPFAAVQRLLQALGAYGRLAALPGCGHFIRHCPAAIRQMRCMLSATDELPALRELVETLTALGLNGIVR